MNIQTQEIVESEPTIVLTHRESLRLLELVEDVPPRNEKFLQAQARYQEARSRMSGGNKE